jgi:hypothetical protein
LSLVQILIASEVLFLPKKKVKPKWIPLTELYETEANVGWKVCVQVGKFEDSNTIVLSFGKLRRNFSGEWHKTNKGFYVSFPYWSDLFIKKKLVLRALMDYAEQQKT